MPKLPAINRKHKICVICEGNEDYEYMMREAVEKADDHQDQGIRHHDGLKRNFNYGYFGNRTRVFSSCSIP